jgi:hypothetical protein
VLIELVSDGFASGSLVHVHIVESQDPGHFLQNSPETKKETDIRNNKEKGVNRIGNMSEISEEY